MNTLKIIVWIVVVGVIAWVGYMFMNREPSAPAAEEQSASVAETLGGGVEASATASGTVQPAPAPAVTPAPAPAPAVTPSPAPAPTY